MPAKSLDVSPEEVLRLTRPAEGYLCPLDANVFGIEFLKFEIRDYDSGKTVYQSPTEPPTDMQFPTTQEEYEDLVRSVKYTFPAEFLHYRTVRTALEFRVGDQPANNFRMIEIHYFKGKVLRVYDFTFGFCIPNSVNTWEAIYDVPAYTEKEQLEYLASPYEHKSDSFYFVDNKLIMHNKAEYQYS